MFMFTLGHNLWNLAFFCYNINKLTYLHHVAITGLSNFGYGIDKYQTGVLSTTFTRRLMPSVTDWTSIVAQRRRFVAIGDVFGRPFVKRFVLCYRTVVCLSCPVCNVGVLWPNGWTDQGETWHAGRPRTWPHCVRWGPSYPSPKRGQSLPVFGPCLLCPNGWTDQDATWHGGRPQRLSPGHIVLDGNPAPLPKRGHSSRQFFVFVVTKGLDGSRCHLVRR